MALLADSRRSARVVACFVFAIGISLAPGAAAAEQPANEDCLACHGDADAKRADGRTIAVHALQFGASVHGGMACVDCHADLATLKEFPHADTLAKVSCATCHEDIASKYRDSIHAYGKEKAGLVVAPGCADCHGKHDVRPPADAASRVNHSRVAETCGTCHAGIKERYDTSVHAAALKVNGKQAPACADCHTAHSISRVETDAWRASVTRECGSCHQESVQTFRDSFHGQVTSLGFVRVAVCADCHGAHDIHPVRDPRSKVASAQLVETCRRCHGGANASFVKYDPHANRHDRSRSPALFYAGRFMDGLLISVFTFFGIHTTLWLSKGIRERRRRHGHDR